MSGLRYRLMGMGLIVPDEALGHAWKLLNRLLILSVLALVVNVGMLLAGIPTTFPGVVVPLLGIFMALGGLVTYSNEKRALRGILSQAGREALDSARRLHVRGARPMAPDLAFAVGVPVALYGLGELGDPTLEEELKRDSGYTSTTGCAAGSCGGGSFGSGTAPSVPEAGAATPEARATRGVARAATRAAGRAAVAAETGTVAVAAETGTVTEARDRPVWEIGMVMAARGRFIRTLTAAPDRLVREIGMVTAARGRFLRTIMAAPGRFVWEIGMVTAVPGRFLRAIGTVTTVPGRLVRATGAGV